MRKCNPAEWGGTETALRLLVSGLHANSVQSTVYAPRLASEGDPDEIAPGVPIQRYRACLPYWGLSAEQRRQMIAVGGNLMSFDLGRKLFTQRDVQLIHTHTLGRLGAVARTAARLRRVPLVVTIHGGLFDLPTDLHRAMNAPVPRALEWGKFFGWLMRARELISSADAVLTCNPREAELLRTRYPRTLVLVQPHGIDLSSYAGDHRAAGRALLPPGSSGPVILCLGRIDPVKNQGWLIERMPEIRRRHPGARLVCVGPITDDAYAAELKQRVEKLQLGDAVVFTGGLPAGSPALVGLLQSAQAVVVPSISETFGLVILEAWAVSAPVLASDTSGARSLVQDGRNGCLFKLDEPEGFLAALGVVLKRPIVARAFGEAGRQRVESEFDRTLLAGRLARLYAALVAARDKRSLEHKEAQGTT